MGKNTYSREPENELKGKTNLFQFYPFSENLFQSLCALV